MMTTLLLAILLAASPAPAAGDCDDPLPIDPAVVTKEMKLDAFGGGDQSGPDVHVDQASRRPVRRGVAQGRGASARAPQRLHGL
jgi:hypothetical protein